MLSLKDEAKKLEQQLISWRRDLHRIPEVGLETPLTAKYLSGQLARMGIEHRMGIGVSGIVGLLKGQAGGKTIALRSDMDGLAIREETGLSFASDNGNMHACGHDAHMAMLLGAARFLQERREEFQGNIKLIFQPAEEGPGGAELMIKEGVLDDPRVEAILGQHIIVSRELQAGKIGVHYGNMMACLDSFKIRVIGKGCHGAMPDTGVDPVVIAGQLIGAIQTITSREIRATNPAVISICKVHGGTAYNIIPDEVVLEGTVRAVSRKIRDRIAARLEELVKGITGSMRGSYEYEYVYGYPPLVNNPEFTARFVQTARKLIPEDKIIELSGPSMIGEDMAYYLEEVPGTFFFLGAANTTKGIIHPHHSARFDIDESVLWLGAALLAGGALEWLRS